MSEQEAPPAARLDDYEARARRSLDESPHNYGYGPVGPMWVTVRPSDLLAFCALARPKAASSGGAS